jgi:hypothetical protein
MPAQQQLINGKSYAWVDIELKLKGITVYGITDISYDEVQEVEDQYGAGIYPVRRGHGAVKYTASITLHMEEIEKLQSIAKDKKLQNIAPFPIPVSYQDGNGKIISHTLKNCQFKNNGRAAKVGDLGLSQKLDLVIAGIDW